jgi:hypothetical protein
MSIRRMMVVAIPVAVSLGYFATNPAASPDRQGFAQWRTQRAPEARFTSSIHGGQRVPVEIKLLPAQVRSSGGAEALDLDVELLNTTTQDARTIVAYEIFTDLGAAVGSKKVSPKADVAAQNQALSSSPGIPANLADGYYVAKATIAWKGPSLEGTAADHFFFRVRGKRIHPMTADAWTVESRVSEGVAQ